MDRASTSWSPPRRGRAGLARTFQHAHSFASLSVRENVEVSAIGVGSSTAVARERATELLDMLALSDLAPAPAGVLPHGEERKLGLARALSTQPRFVLMDEPAAGLSEGEVGEFADVIRAVRDRYEAGVLLIDHNIPLIMDVCDRIQLLAEGRTLAEGTPDEIRQNIDVAEAYLGGSGARGDTHSGDG